jgi:tetratricopeptide (TPR) repeat protein
MESRLMRSLRQRAAAATDPVQAAVLEAQIAIGHARQGESDEAEAIVRTIRERFGGARPNAEALAWASLAEAVNRFYQHPGPEATDRLLRAQALGRMLPPTELQPLSAAWLAHVEFNANRMERMVGHAAEALRLAQPDHHGALARVSLVVADAYHFAGRFDLAKGWYAAVRDHALAVGDDAMMSALLHNIAAFRANNVRVSAVFEKMEPEQAARAMLEAESTKNYDLGIGNASLDLFVPLVQAQLLTVMGRFQEAVALFESHLARVPEQGMSRLLPSYFADVAWCNLNLGRKADARAAVLQAQALPMENSDPDDLATAYARIARVLRALGDSNDAEHFEVLAAEQLSRHHAAQAEALRLLGQRLVDPPSILRR